MPGLDPSVAIHQLATDPIQQPVKQHPRKAKHDIAEKIKVEVEKLLKARFLREVRYPKWLENIVPVQKKNGQIRVCIDYRDRNGACPKDDFPLPLIELLVDATMGYELSPSWMVIQDTTKSKWFQKRRRNRVPHPDWNILLLGHAFWLEECWRHLPEANDQYFEDLLRDVVECYVDDLVVKTKLRQRQIDDLDQVFQ